MLECVTKSIRVMVVDDHDQVRASLGRVLATAPDIEYVGGIADGERAMDACRDLAPDVILMDRRLPGIDGIDAAAKILRAHREVRVVMLSTMMSAPQRVKAAAAGVSGILLKDASIEEILAALRAAASRASYRAVG